MYKGPEEHSLVCEIPRQGRTPVKDSWVRRKRQSIDGCGLGRYNRCRWEDALDSAALGSVNESIGTLWLYLFIGLKSKNAGDSLQLISHVNRSREHIPKYKKMLHILRKNSRRLHEEVPKSRRRNSAKGIITQSME
uniref:AlNc14C18G1926 protein n=1 Tax=Albugo laibachii Nc14 TaxID=890382 RepID=F0W4V6_9STRA|nr:AlNc14C18G1926 [Albugo laibachii Nc14]CCA25105.1 AlNc14C275G10032 [Albugo laibachii Nc14]|eukprot:CCA25105.1 AlNc14C275G10032 [Albugo laibachii Nc14]